MTMKDVKRVARKYDNDLKPYNAMRSERCDNAAPVELSHLRWMCQQILSWNYTRKEKAMRWLGFIQGVMCESRRYSIGDVKQHNMGGGE